MKEHKPFFEWALTNKWFYISFFGYFAFGLLLEFVSTGETSFPGFSFSLLISTGVALLFWLVPAFIVWLIMINVKK